MKLEFGYGKGVQTVEVAEKNLLAVLTSNPMTHERGGEEAVRHALENPIGCEKLQKITGKTIELTNRVDPDVLGGVRLDYNGKCVDGTVKNRMDKMRALLQNTV